MEDAAAPEHFVLGAADAYTCKLELKEEGN